MSKKIINIIGISITAILIVCMIFISPKTEYNFKIIGEKDSYAEKFANKHKIDFEEVYESNKDEYHKEVQQLEYKSQNGTLVVDNYSGESDVLVIPKENNGRKITKINPNFLSSTNIKTIVIQENIEKLDETILKDYDIECYNNTYCNTLDKKNYKNIKILDEFPYNYINSEFDFEYNKEKEEITLKEYNDSSDYVVIPSQFNGMKVTNIDFDIEKSGISEIYIPDTVTKISLTDSTNNSIIISIVITILSLIIYIILNSIMTFKNLEESFNNTPRAIIMIIFLIGVDLVSLVYCLNKIELNKLLLYAILIILFEIILYVVLEMSKNHIEKHNKLVKDANNYKDELLMLLSNKKKENNKLTKLEEKIKYSNPMSIAEVNEIEKELKEKVSFITKNTTNEEIDEMISLVNKRNKIIKENK